MAFYINILWYVARYIALFPHQTAEHINNAVVLVSPQTKCLHLMYSEIAWVLVTPGIQNWRQIFDTETLETIFLILMKMPQRKS